MLSFVYLRKGEKKIFFFEPSMSSVCLSIQIVMWIVNVKVILHFSNPLHN